jgi:hypothetical protein
LAALEVGNFPLGYSFWWIGCGFHPLEASLPIIVGEVDHDRLRGASYNNPDKTVIS